MKKITSLTLLLITLFFKSGFSQTLDQSQLVYNGGMSARTLPGYSFFQSFTAGLTGTLVRIDLGVFNYINGAGTLIIYSGSNNLGTVLQTIPVTVNCASGNCFSSFVTSVSVIAGQVYTFHFIPGAGIPDPYGVQVQMVGSYSGGQFGLIDPSGTYYNGFDLVFRTYVNTTLGIETTTYNTISIFPNPTEDFININAAENLSNISIVDLNGKLIQKISNGTSRVDLSNLSAGTYFLTYDIKGKHCLNRIVRK